MLQEIISRDEAKARGLKRFFTGEPCVNGHIAERYTSIGTCLMCRAEYTAAPGFKEKQSLYNASYREQNIETARSYGQAYHIANKEKINARSRAFMAENKEHRRAYMVEYTNANREAKRISIRSRYARERGAEGSFTKSDIDRIRRQQKGRCAYCRISLKHGEHIDHIVPIIKGGTNWPSNLQLTCPLCNRQKHDDDPIEWAKKKGRLL